MAPVDDRLTEACASSSEAKSGTSPSDLEIVRDRIPFLTEMKMELESKRGLTRYLQARAYCRAVNEALRLTMSDKARDATRTSSSVLEIDHVRLPYRHLVIQAAFDVTWFRNSAGDGVVYHEQFSPVPVPAIAFVLTVIECCIDEWAGGLHQETGWDKERFKTVYRSHISSLGDFQRHAIGDTLEHIQSDLLKEARKHADVPPVPITKLRGFTQTL